jgi:hypothetical protein
VAAVALAAAAAAAAAATAVVPANPEPTPLPAIEVKCSGPGYAGTFMNPMLGERGQQLKDPAVSTAGAARDVAPHSNTHPHTRRTTVTMTRTRT